jgi:hydrogenase maturation protease
VRAHGQRILVLGLGNDILGDDAVGLLAARRLRASLPASVDVQESAGAGLDLLDVLEGYGGALILDAIVTGAHPPGTVLEFSAADFREVVAPSPHFAGLPELLQMARQLAIPFPETISVLACEVADPYQIREGLSPPADAALPALVARAERIVASWVSGSAPPPSPEDSRRTGESSGLDD